MLVIMTPYRKGEFYMFKKFTDFLERAIQPAAAKMSQNTVIRAITQGMLGILTITVGASIVSILVNLPIDPWLDFLTNAGILAPAKELVTATTSLLAIYVVISVSYSYATITQEDPRATVLISTAVFILIMPQTITLGEASVGGLLASNLGSNGLFVALLVAILVSSLYHFLIKKNIRLKMPESVPSMVSDAMSPIFAAMIIFMAAFVVKYILTLTDYKDLFSLFYSLITAPAMMFGTTIWTPILYCVFRSVFWFFGIHPSPLNAIFLPLSTAAVAANVEAASLGNELPYLAFVIMTSFGLIGGSGSTFGLSLNMFGAKSERYKSLNKIAFVPGVFNINEPYVFGVPLMYNPVMLIPMILAPLVGCLVGYQFYALGLINSGNFNASASVGWVVPYPIAAFLRGGFWFMLAVLVVIVIQVIIYRPFFTIIDKQAYLEEQQNTPAE